MNARVGWIDYAKGIAIIAVVFGHVLVSIYNAGIGFSEAIHNFLFDFIWSFHMPVFFFLSGLFVSKSLEKSGNYGFVLNKFKTLIYPYLVWSLLQGGVQSILSGYINTRITVFDLMAILYRPLPNTHFWFLYALAVMFLIYVIIETVKPDSPYIIFLLSASFFLFAGPSSIVVVNKILLNFIYFALGVLCQKYLFGKYFHNATFITSVLCFCVFVFLEWMVFELNILPVIRLTKFLVAVSGIAAVIAISKYLDGKSYIRILRRIGAASMPIYLAHILAISATRITLSRLIGIEDAFVNALLGVVSGVAIPMAIYHISMKFNFPYLFGLKAA